MQNSWLATTKRYIHHHLISEWKCKVLRSSITAREFSSSYLTKNLNAMYAIPLIFFIIIDPLTFWNGFLQLQRWILTYPLTYDKISLHIVRRDKASLQCPNNPAEVSEIKANPSFHEDRTNRKVSPTYLVSQNKEGLAVYHWMPRKALRFRKAVVFLQLILIIGANKSKTPFGFDIIL